MSITDRVLDALKNAVLLESRVSTLAGSVAELARDVREMDRRLVRLETIVELARRPARARPAIGDTD
jgi:uncharacterized protein involved in exopolysaccharide biosynthesis